VELGMGHMEGLQKVDVGKGKLAGSYGLGEKGEGEWMKKVERGRRGEERKGLRGKEEERRRGERKGGKRESESGGVNE